VGDTSAARLRLEPGWKWSERIKPIAGTDSCQIRHLGVVQSGRLHVTHEDGSEGEIGPGDAYVDEPGHDARVVGDEPLVGFEFRPSGGRGVREGLGVGRGGQGLGARLVPNGGDVTWYRRGMHRAAHRSLDEAPPGLEELRGVLLREQSGEGSAKGFGAQGKPVPGEEYGLRRPGAPRALQHPTIDSSSLRGCATQRRRRSVRPVQAGRSCGG
jgi:hypothetical protein